MNLLNSVLISNKFYISFWSYHRSYYERGKYNRFNRTYRRLKRLTGLEQYINQEQITKAKQWGN